MILKIILWASGILIILTIIGVIGFFIPSKPYRFNDRISQNLGTIPLPDNLPPLIQAYFQNICDGEIPVIESALVWGKARIKIAGFWIPLYWKQYFNAGESFKWLAEIKWFGFNIMKVVDQYINDKGRMIIGGQTFEGEDFDQGENARLWAEQIWLPTILISDSRVTWETIDAARAKMTYPFKDTTEEAVVTFDPNTHLISRFMFQRASPDKPGKIPWKAELMEYKKHNNIIIPVKLNVANDEDVYYELTEFHGIIYNTDPPPEFHLAESE